MSLRTAPIFVVGVDRSGTTLLSLMLDAHSRLAIPFESHFFVRFYNGMERFGDLMQEVNRRALVAAILAEPYLQKWEHRVSPEEVDLDRCGSLSGAIAEIYTAYARSFGKDVWGDKTPEYISHLWVLNELFPEGRFVHIIRDGRDVASSIVKQWWGAKDFASALRYWAQNVALARSMLRMLPHNRYVELRFEDLVADPGAQLARITDLLGLDFEPAMLSAYQEKAAAKVGDLASDVHPHLHKSPMLDQALKWQRELSPPDQALAHKIAGPLLAELGYPSGVTKHPLSLWRAAYHRMSESWKWRTAKARAKKR
ncbi:MAG: sulfotransferase [Thermodesulfobacteriota bacterium]